MTSRWQVLALLAVGISVGSTAVAAMRTASIVVRVVEEDGSPCPGAKVTVGFWTDTRTGVGNVNIEGVSNLDGVFEAKAETSGYVSWGAQKPGYYRSVGIFDFKDHKLGRWQPWGAEQTLVLRKIGNPVPMYARYSADQLPEFGKRIGYDLAVADWVSPYGTGNHADLYFEGLCDLRADADYDCSLRVSFLSPFDGIQLVKEDRRSGSAFHLPRFAPEDGYQSELVLSGSSRPRKSYDRGCKEDDNYILRTRSVVVDEKLVRAMYAKIPGGICISPEVSKTLYIVMTYFLNPDYTRNLEFDPKRNLFPPRTPGTGDGRTSRP